MLIRSDTLDYPEVQHLLQHHFTELRSQGRPETSFALDLTAFLDPSITLYTAWEGDSLSGCGALKQLSPTHGEIKSMRTAPGHLRKGVAKTILKHIVAEARERKYQSLSLETGTDGRFESARRLYLGMGFEQHFILFIYLLPNDPESTFAQNLARARVSLLAEGKDFFSRLSPVFCRSQLRLTR
ncbi:hypothetical protein LV164_002198 [Aspergillus fumigatus]|nr:hypothetical protein KXX57_008066 [Aspergillus fumigatus]KAH2653967.1 hypothetical protein KXV32_003218 [Aspergillus fumigatus]KAH3005445.1 hypothetical protein KXW60_004883 [Aspergillus fumigatus]KAH3204218.1 hypothetical protein KXW62_006618 [Aspergillus fumigatus]KAJ8195356.1 hypothetical protein LV157_002177 [Aspergillus fumigatus]